MKAAAKWAARPEPQAKQRPIARTVPKSALAEPPAAAADAEPAADDADSDSVQLGKTETEGEHVQGDVAGSMGNTAPIDLPMVAMDIDDFRKRGYVDTPEGERIYPVPKHMRKHLDKLLCRVLRHGDEGVNIDLCGRVSISALEDVLQRCRNDLQKLDFMRVMATMAVDHRYKFWGGIYDQFMNSTHVSCVQGHAVPIDLGECMVQLQNFELPMNVVHFYVLPLRRAHLDERASGGRRQAERAPGALPSVRALGQPPRAWQQGGRRGGH